MTTAALFSLKGCNIERKGNVFSDKGDGWPLLSLKGLNNRAYSLLHTIRVLWQAGAFFSLMVQAFSLIQHDQSSTSQPEVAELLY